MTKAAAERSARPKTQLPVILKEMAKLQTAIAELSNKYDGLRDKAFPLVAAAGGKYEVDGIKAQIIRGQTWDADAVRLMDKFGKKVHGLLTVSASNFRKAFESGLLGTKTDLRGIAKLVDVAPKFRLSQK